MKHENEGNQLNRAKVTWSDKLMCKKDVFRLMLKEELTHLYFYQQQQAENSQFLVK